MTCQNNVLNDDRVRDICQKKTPISSVPQVKNTTPIPYPGVN